MQDITHDLLSQNLALNIVNLRKKRKMTQSALAKVSGLPRSTLASMECGMGNPSLQNLAKVCEALHVSFEELLATPRSSVKLIRKEDIPTNRRAKGNVLVYKLLPDAIPGMAIPIWFQPTTNGTFLINCAQLCGNSHYYMKGQFRVVPQAEYDEFVAAKSATAGAAAQSFE